MDAGRRRLGGGRLGVDVVASSHNLLSKRMEVTESYALGHRQRRDDEVALVTQEHAPLMASDPASGLQQCPR